MPACRIDSDEKCAFSNMIRDQQTLVYPGGATRCLFSYSSEYAFQVIPGDSDKLLFHFQGIGSCWDQKSTFGTLGTMCADSVYTEPGWSGIFQRENTTNPFKSYTVVVVLYCSGDLHVGDTVQQYTDMVGEFVEQRGYQNAKSAVDWAFANLGAGLQSLVVTGSSVGSIGAQLWANKLLGTFKYANAAVILDGFADVLPPAADLALLQRLGFCSAAGTSGSVVGALQPEVKCEPGFSLRGVLTDTMSRFPSVAFAVLTSRTDLVQIAFYNALAASFSKVPVLPDRQFPHELRLSLYELNKSPNFVSYIVEGFKPMFLPSPWLYTSGLRGPDASRRPGGDAGAPLVVDWLASFPVASETQVGSHCFGPTVNRSDWEDWQQCQCSNVCDWAVSHKVLSP